MYLPTFRTVALKAFLATLFLSPWTTIPAQNHGLECEDFQLTGHWELPSAPGASGGRILFSGNDGASTPAVTAVQIPREGRYTLWVRSTDFPEQNPGSRYFNVSIGGRMNSTPFGVSGKSGWTWEKGDRFELESGKTLLSITDNDSVHFARADAIILSADPDFVPEGTLDEMGLPALESVPIELPDPSVPVSSAGNLDSTVVLAELENEHVQVRFHPVTRNGQDSAAPVIRVRDGDSWRAFPGDPSAESYQVLSALPETELLGVVNTFHPRWSNRPDKTNRIEVDGVSTEVSTATSPYVVWDAGIGEEFIVQSVRQASENRIQLEFHPSETGRLEADWELASGETSVKIRLRFTPSHSGQYSLGYFFPGEFDMSDVQELLLPPVVNRRRFPTQAYTVLGASSPTPVSLAELRHPEGSITLGLAADAESVPFEFPTPIDSRFGLQIRSPNGKVQSSIYGPLIGTRHAAAEARQPIEFTLRLLAENGDWYAGYRTAPMKSFNGVTTARAAGFP